MPSQGKLLNMDILLRLLDAIGRLGPTSLYRAAKEAGLTYPTARRYLEFSIERGLIINLGRGPKGGFQLMLSDKGRVWLTMLRNLKL